MHYTALIYSIYIYIAFKFRRVAMPAAGTEQPHHRRATLLTRRRGVTPGTVCPPYKPRPLIIRWILPLYTALWLQISVTTRWSHGCRQPLIESRIFLDPGFLDLRTMARNLLLILPRFSPPQQKKNYTLTMYSCEKIVDPNISEELES